MTSVWTAVAVGGASLIGGLYSANRAANAQENAADRAAGISQQSSAAQLAFLREQSAQARNDQLPFLAGGTGAYSEFLKQLGVTPAPVAVTQRPGTSASGASLIPLPGITTTGTHSQQTNGGGLGGLLDNPLNVTRAGLAGLGANAVVRPGGGTGQQLFFDRDRRMVVDADGNLVAQVPQGAGTITGLLHGYNNAVRIDDQGNLVSVGSRGENPLNIRLQGLSAEERAALGANTGTPATGTPATGTPATGTSGTGADRYGAYFSSPGYKFLYDETMRASKASGAARGSLYSGAMLKELQNRAAGVAAQDYGSYMTRLAEAARVGQAAASGTAANATNLGNSGATIIGNAGSDQANARLISGASQASSIIGANNAFQSTLGSGLTALGNYYANRGPG